MYFFLGLLVDCAFTLDNFQKNVLIYTVTTEMFWFIALLKWS